MVAIPLHDRKRPATQTPPPASCGALPARSDCIEELPPPQSGFHSGRIGLHSKRRGQHSHLQGDGKSPEFPTWESQGESYALIYQPNGPTPPTCL